MCVVGEGGEVCVCACACTCMRVCRWERLVYVCVYVCVHVKERVCVWVKKYSVVRLLEILYHNIERVYVYTSGIHYDNHLCVPTALALQLVHLKRTSEGVVSE